MNADFRIDGKVLETERLILRAFTDSDLRDFHEYASEDGVGEMAGWKHHESVEETKKILDLFIKEDKVFAVCLKDSGKVVGSVGVEKYGMEEKLTEFSSYKGREIGYVLGREHWGKGIMTEAVKAVIGYLFDEKSLDFLICGHYDFNTRSARVQEKLGFRLYRKVTMTTDTGAEEGGVLTLLLNPNKNVVLDFSHRETLIR